MCSNRSTVRVRAGVMQHLRLTYIVQTSGSMISECMTPTPKGLNWIATLQKNKPVDSMTDRSRVEVVLRRQDSRQVPLPGQDSIVHTVEYSVRSMTVMADSSDRGSKRVCSTPTDLNRRVQYVTILPSGGAAFTIGGEDLDSASGTSQGRYSYSPNSTHICTGIFLASGSVVQCKRALRTDT